MKPQPPAPITLSGLDRFLLNWMPSFGRQRVINKMAIASATQVGYITPGSQKTSMQAWGVSNNLVEYDALRPLNGLRAGSRDMFMNTPIAVGALRRMQTNVVGFGLMVQSRIDNELLNLSVEQAEEWQRGVESEWRYWCESKECDVRRTSDFYELQALAFMSELLSGDAFVLLPFVRRPGVAYDLRVQLIESDYVSNPFNAMDTMKLAGGVEVDENGAPIAYHVKSFPKEMIIQSFNSLFATWTRIPAFGESSGRRNVLHLFRPDRPGQRRGVPILAPVIEPLKQLSRLTEAELAAAVVTSLFTVFIKNIPTGLPGSGFLPEQDVTQNRPDAAKLYQMGPGSMISLMDNEEIQVADPKRPNGAFEPFFLSIVKQIGSALEIPFEQLMLMYSASYSASRGAVLEAWKMYKTHRARFVRNFCQPIYEAWLMEAVMRGRVEAPGFIEDPVIRAAWSRTKWTGPGQGMLNPESEAKAKLSLINGCLSTYEEEYTELHGGDWEGAARILSRERKLKAELGLLPEEPVVPGPGRPPENREAPPTPPTDTETEDEDAVAAVR